ncbi:MAG: ribbon-helix-helix domain-containing protein [Rhodomicrobium sp.]
MSTHDTTRWTIVVSKETDIVVRSLLAQRGLKKGDLSKFIEEAVNWRVFDQTLTEVRSKFSDMTPDALEDLIAEACAAARKETRRLLKKEH